MEPPIYDSRGWTGETAIPPPAPPFKPPGPRSAIVLSDEQRFAGRHALCLLLSPIALLIASSSLGLSTRNLLVEAPSLLGWGALAALVGICCLRAAFSGFLPKLIGRFCQVGWLAILFLAGWYLVNGAQSLGGQPSRPLRAQVAAIENSSKGRSRTFLALQDGSTAATYDYPAGTYGSLGRCLSVVRISSSSGFAWLRIVDASPLPEGGQLAWPIEREECFRAADLSTLH